MPDGEGNFVVFRAYVDASSRELVRASDGEKGDLLTVAGYLFESRQRGRVFCQRWGDTFRSTEPFSWADLVACEHAFGFLRDGNGKVIKKDLDPLVAAGIALVNEPTPIPLQGTWRWLVLGRGQNETTSETVSPTSSKRAMKDMTN